MFVLIFGKCYLTCRIVGKAKNCFDNYNAESEAYLRRAVKLNYNHVEAWNTLAECLWK